MAITYVGGQVAGRANPSSALSVNYALTGGSDSLPSAGDFVIVCAVTGSAAGNPAMAVTTPATWIALGQLNQAAVTADTSLNVSHKFMPATPDTAVTIPGTGNNAFGEAYSIQVFRGVDQTTPLDVTSVSAGGTGTGRPNPGTITPATAGAWVVICGGGAAGTGANYTAPANFATNFLTANGADTTDAMVGSGYWTGWTSGAVDPAVYTGGTTGANDSWSAYTIVLRPISAVAHDASGALAGPGTALAGTAARTRVHAADGALVGQASTIAGTAARTRAHASDGVLAGAGAEVAGAANREAPGPVSHDTSGALSGSGAEIVAAAARDRLHAATGELAGPGAEVAGSASRTGAPVSHPSTGALVGPGADVTGSASRKVSHPASGVLAGSGAVIVGSASRAAAPVSHASSGALVGPGAALSGSAALPSSEIFVGPPGEEPRPRRNPAHHAAAGRLVGRGAKLRGSASRTTTGQNAIALVMSSV